MMDPTLNGLPPEPPTANASMLRRASELSPLDRDLIHALQRDGRISFATLGPRLGTTEKTVRLRHQALSEAGIIHVTVVTNPAFLGYSQASLIGLRVADGERRSVVAQLSEIQGVDYIASTVGRYDVMVELLSASLHDLATVLDERVASLEHVRTIDVYPYLSVFLQQAVFGDAGDDGSHQPVGEALAYPEHDDIDIAIIKNLSDDGRRPYLQIARDVNTSGDIVRRRVARLREHGVIKIMAITNPMTLGFDVVAVTGIRLGQGANSRQVAQALSDMAAVTYVAICTGGYDIIAEFACQTAPEFQEVLDQVRSVPGVARIEPFLYSDLQYRRVVPAG